MRNLLLSSSAAIIASAGSKRLTSENCMNLGSTLRRSRSSCDYILSTGTQYFLSANFIDVYGEIEIAALRGSRKVEGL